MTVNKTELFETAIGKEIQFKEYDAEELLMIGEFIGHNPLFFKEIYKTHQNREIKVEHKASMGAAVAITFNYKTAEVRMKRDKVEMKLTMDLFLQFMSLVDACFLEMIPAGSVVDVDLHFSSPATRELFEKDSRGALIIINERKVSLEGNLSKFVVDYIGSLWPLGSPNTTKPVYLTNAIINNIVHRGMSNELEKEVSLRFKLDAIEQKKKSIAFLTSKEIDEIRELEQKNKEESR